MCIFVKLPNYTVFWNVTTCWIPSYSMPVSKEIVRDRFFNNSIVFARSISIFCAIAARSWSTRSRYTDRPGYQSFIPVQNLPDPYNWGWIKEDGTWQPLWTTLPEAADVCLELVKCGCQKGCGSRCKCHNINLSCTYLCFCAGQCDPFH